MYFLTENTRSRCEKDNFCLTVSRMPTCSSGQLVAHGRCDSCHGEGKTIAKTTSTTTPIGQESYNKRCEILDTEIKVILNASFDQRQVL